MKISENTSVSMPVTNMLMIIAGVVSGVFAYTEITARLTFRKYLGNLQCNERNDLALENEKLRQQLELMKMCNKVNRNPTLKHNSNFDLLVSKCRAVSYTHLTLPTILLV